MNRVRDAAFPRLALLSVLLLGAGGCSESVDVPQPDMAGAEDEVVRAVKRAQRAVRKAPDSAEAWGRLGDRYMDFYWWKEAAASFERAEQLDPANFRWPYLLGHSRLLDDPAGASAAFGRALAIDGSYGPAHVYFARTLVQLGKLDQARQHFKRAVGLNPGNAEPLLGLGQLALEAGEIEEARDYLVAAVQRNPQHGKAHTTLARVYFAVGDHAAAQRHSETARGLPKDAAVADPRIASRVEPAGSFLLYQEGKKRAVEGRLDEAAKYLREAVRIDPRLEKAHYHLANVLAKQANLTEAEKHLRIALEVSPSYVKGHALLGDLLSRQGRLDEAVAHLQEALRLNPDDAGSRYLLGRSLADAGRPEQAETHFNVLLAANPDDDRAHHGIGLVLVEMGRLDDAAGHFMEILETYQRRIEAESARATRAGLQGNPAAASRHRVAVHQLQQQSAEALYRLGSVSLMGGAAEEAAARLAEAARIRPDRAEIQFELAQAYAETGRFNEALTAAQRALGVAESSGQGELAVEIHERIREYESGQSGVD